MEKVKEQLRLIREGSGAVITENVEYNDITLAEAALDIIMLEATLKSSQLHENAIGSITLDSLLREASDGSAVSVGFIDRLKQKFRALKQHFDPYDGIKELRLVNELKEDLDNKQRANLWLGTLGMIIAAYKRGAKYEKFPKELVPEYIKEANKFKAKLEKQVGDARKSNDRDTINKLNTHIDKLEKAIKLFESRTEE